MTLSPPRLFRDWRAALVLVAFACVAAPERATAGCGDYVHILSAGEPDPLPPCQGPNCSAAPAQPDTPLAPAVSLNTRSKETAHVLIEVVHGRPALRAFGRDPISLVPVARPPAIFHPPRVG